MTKFLPLTGVATPALYSLSISIFSSLFFSLPLSQARGAGFWVSRSMSYFRTLFFSKKNLTPQHLSSNIFTEGRNSHAVLWNGINADENGKAGFGTLTHTHKL